MECLVTTLDSKNTEKPMFGDGQSHEIGRSLRDETMHFDDKQLCMCVFSHTKSADTQIFLCLLGSGRDCLNILIRRCFFSKTSSFYMLQFLPCDMTCPAS